MPSIQLRKLKKTLAVLKTDLTRRLNSLVLVSSQDSESVISRTPSQSIETSTPFDSASSCPETPLKNQTPGLFLPKDHCEVDYWDGDSQLSFCSYSEISSISSEVFLDSEHFNPPASDPIKQLSIDPLRNEESLAHHVTQIMDEAAAEEEIVLRGQTLTFKLQTYVVYLQ